MIYKFKRLTIDFLICFTTDGPSGSGSSRSDDAERRRKKKSRWAGGDHDKTFIPGMPTILPAGMTQDQQEAYLGEFSASFLQMPFLFSFRWAASNRRRERTNPKEANTEQLRKMV